MRISADNEKLLLSKISRVCFVILGSFCAVFHYFQICILNFFSSLLTRKGNLQEHWKGTFDKIIDINDRTSGNGFNFKESRFRLAVRKNYYCEGVKTLAQVAQRSHECPIPASVQSQAEWGCEQPGLVEGMPAHGRCPGNIRFYHPFQSKPFCDSMIITLNLGKDTFLIPDVSHFKSRALQCSACGSALHWAAGIPRAQPPM